MDDPFRYIRPEKEEEYHFHPDHLKESKELALKSAVLLKNDGVLPLDKTIKRLAIIGPFGDSKDQLGPWQGTKYHEQTITLAEGIRQLVPHVELDIVKGHEVNEEMEGGMMEARLAVQEADVVLLALGETWIMSGEALLGWISAFLRYNSDWLNSFWSWTNQRSWFLQTADHWCLMGWIRK